jgi:hypothetical protein
MNDPLKSLSPPPLRAGRLYEREVKIRSPVLQENADGGSAIDTFDSAKPRFSDRDKKRRSVSTLGPSALLGVLSLSKGIPRVLVLSMVEGSDGGTNGLIFHTI